MIKFILSLLVVSQFSVAQVPVNPGYDQSTSDTEDTFEIEMKAFKEYTDAPKEGVHYFKMSEGSRFLSCFIDTDTFDVLWPKKQAVLSCNYDIVDGVIFWLEEIFFFPTDAQKMRREINACAKSSRTLKITYKISEYNPVGEDVWTTGFSDILKLECI